MRRRNSGRWLAPLALVIVAIAAYAIVQGGSSKGGTSGSGAGATTTTATTTTRRRARPAAAPGHARTLAKKPSGAATYTVRQGDTPSAIAARTGVPLARLRALNPGLVDSNLHIGQQIRLRP